MKTDIARLRLANQHLESKKFNSVKELVAWMGAMQAQDYGMAKWGVGVRVNGLTDKIVENALSKGEILRTHVLRPTWHFVSSDDIYWILELTAPHIKRWLKSRDKFIGLSDKIYSKVYSVLETALRDGQSLTRDELKPLMEKKKINLDENRASHLYMGAELEGIICSGEIKKAKQTFALLQERVPKPNSINKDEALGRLSLRYFTSHGPASLDDFTWWSGLTIKEAKKAIDISSDKLLSQNIDSKTYLFTGSVSDTKKKSLHLLPAFDEYIISYKDRDAAVLAEYKKLTFSNYGIFKAVILLNGKVIGIWKRLVQKDKVIISGEFFGKQDKNINKLLLPEVQKFASFLDKEPIINF